MPNQNRFFECTGSYTQPRVQPYGGACRDCGRLFLFEQLAGAARVVPKHSPEQQVEAKSTESTFDWPEDSTFFLPGEND